MKTFTDKLATAVIPTVIAAGTLTGCEVSISSHSSTPVETNKSAFAKKEAAAKALALETGRSAVKAYERGDNSYELLTPDHIPNDGTLGIERSLFDKDGHLVSQLLVRQIGQTAHDLVGKPDVRYVDAWTGSCPTAELTPKCTTETRATIEDTYDSLSGFMVSIEYSNGDSLATAYNPYYYCLEDQGADPDCRYTWYSVKNDEQIMTDARSVIAAVR